MSRIRERVRLHPATVARAEQIAAEIEAAKRISPRKCASRVEKTQVHPRVWKVAMRLAGGRVKRIQVHSETCVVVTNK